MHRMMSSYLIGEHKADYLVPSNSDYVYRQTLHVSTLLALTRNRGTSMSTLTAQQFRLDCSVPCLRAMEAQPAGVIDDRIGVPQSVRAAGRTHSSKYDAYSWLCGARMTDDWRFY